MKPPQESYLRTSHRQSPKPNISSKTVLFQHKYSTWNAQKIHAKRECLRWGEIIQITYHPVFYLRRLRNSTINQLLFYHILLIIRSSRKLIQNKLTTMLSSKSALMLSHALFTSDQAAQTMNWENNLLRHSLSNLTSLTWMLTHSSEMKMRERLQLDLNSWIWLLLVRLSQLRWLWEC